MSDMRQEKIYVVFFFFLILACSVSQFNPDIVHVGYNLTRLTRHVRRFSIITGLGSIKTILVLHARSGLGSDIKIFSIFHPTHTHTFPFSLTGPLSSVSVHSWGRARVNNHTSTNTPVTITTIRSRSNSLTHTHTHTLLMSVCSY